MYINLNSVTFVQEKLEKMENENKFEFSEMYIFGKFDTFTKRLSKIIEMFETFEMYSHLADSKIEGTGLMLFYPWGTRSVG